LREHQININLKAQQFELLQKLAREKGYKSVSAYVREKVMELAFGLESQTAGGQSASGPANLDGEALKELSRIHNEMQQFIKESLGLGADAQMPHGVMEQAQDSKSKAMSEAAWAGQSSGPKDAFDLALGIVGSQPINVVPPFDVNSLADDLSYLAGNTPSAESFYESKFLDQAAPIADSRSANQAAADAFFNTGGAKSSSESMVTESNQAIFSSNHNLGGFAYSLGNYSNFGGNSFVARFGATGDSGSDRLNGYKEILDDLEELADRAFAISPRLGSLTEDAGEQPAAVEDSAKVAPDSASGRKTSHHSAPPAATSAAPKSVAAPEPTNFAAPAPPPEVVAPAAPVPAPAPAPVAAPATLSAPAAIPPPAAPEVVVAQSEPPAISAVHQPVHFDPLSAAEDDLLDDLLDGDLLAQANAPRETNPFAVDLPFGNFADTQDGLENFGPLDSEDTGVADDPEQVQLDQTVNNSFVHPGVGDQDIVSALVPAEPVSVTGQPALPTPEAVNEAEVASNTAAESTVDASQPPAQSDLSGNSTTATQSNQGGYQEEAPGYFQVDSQDANSMGVSGLSGGPPPKRRRS